MRGIFAGAPPVAHPTGVFLKESKITQVVARPDRPAGITRHHISEGLAPRRSVSIAEAQRIHQFEWRRSMNKLLTTVVLAAIIIASPALAQSYDPDIGSGNIAPPASHPYGE